MANVEHEPIMGTGGFVSSDVQGQSPWSGGRGDEGSQTWKLFSLCTTKRDANLPHSCWFLINTN